MTKQEIFKQLSPLIDLENKTITTRENRQIEIDVFCDMFKEYDLTYESLSTVKKDTGWRAIFDEWKQQGILN